MEDRFEQYFPSSFVWGAATASYQIEGAVDDDGRGESIWDRFSHTPGKVRAGDTGDIACDHYHRYRGDVSLMHTLGLRGYRFSVSWPRILPSGTGTVEPRGLDFYDRLVDELLESDIEPYCTLYHWDLPQALEDAGGWPDRSVVDAYAAYAEIVVRRLGDRVKRWITHNEPWVVAWMGYGMGVHAPGRRDTNDALAAVHHLLLSHGRAVDIVRRDCPQGEVGITLNLAPVHPVSLSERDRAAARLADGRQNRWFLDPIFWGSYPEDVAREYGWTMPPIEPGDLETIARPIDFLGINYYSRQMVSADGETGRPVHVRPQGDQFTTMDWEVHPDALHELLVRVHRDYAPAQVYVTENGAAYDDVQVHDGSIRDVERQSYLEAHLRACAHAIRDGVPLAGYFYWSLLDNFEWGWGYQKRFGLVYVDYPTQERVPKGSFDWYRRFIQRHVRERAA